MTRTRRARRRRQLVTCPHCRTRLPGLLAGCQEPACLTADLNHDDAIDRRDDA